jgi:hypothetical protein
VVERALILWLFGVVAMPAWAIDSLGVGWRGSIARWNQGVAEASFVAIRADSIWTWDVQPNSNLAPATPERSG